MKESHHLIPELSLPIRAQAELNARHLKHNYEILRKLGKGQSLLPMIKANAYGHDAVWAARILSRLPDLYGLGVATLEEGAQVRDGIGNSKTPVIVFSGANPWSDPLGNYCEKWNLTPVIGTLSDWEKFSRSSWIERLPYHLKFNTGMNRLGLPLSALETVSRRLLSASSRAWPMGVLSHLAQGEKPSSSLSRKQLRAFEEIRKQLSPLETFTRFHLANSAALWNASSWKLKSLTSIVRPGLSLYGIRPWKEAPSKNLKSVLTLRFRIIDTPMLKPGDQVGYGGRYRVSGNKSVPIAILAGGYDDGIHRLLGNQRGQVWIRGKRLSFVGAVSMDLSACQCPPGTRSGEWVEVLGTHIDPWRQAEAAQTIPYELLTSLTSRVQRTYV